MSNVSKYSGSYAKVCAMQGRLLSSVDYEELFNCNSVEDITEYLKKTPGYSGLFENMTETVSDRKTLEKILAHAADRDLVKLRRFMNSDGKKFMDFLVMKKEIEILKEILRCIQSGVRFDFDSGILYSNLSFDVQSLSDASNVYDFIEKLRDTKYHQAVSDYNDDEYPGLFGIEMSLDRYYYKRIWSMAKKTLYGKDREMILSSVGREADVLNIIWILRCKQYFDVPYKTIRDYLIPISYKIKPHVLDEMADSSTIEELYLIIGRTKYAELFKDRTQNYEQLWANTTMQRESKDSKLSQFSIFAVIEYCHKKETEINNIIRIAEAIKYEIGKDEIPDYITMKGGICSGG